MSHRFSRPRRLLTTTMVGLAPVLVVTAAPIAATLTPAYAAVDAGLSDKLDAVLSDARAQRAKTGAVVLDAGDGELLYSAYGKRAVIPASNTKVLTAVAAMHALTPGYRFKTEVISRGSVVGGTLHGRLYLKGYGDPTTQQADYARLAGKVAAAGVKRVDGSLIVDASWFDDERYNPGWKTSYADDYYAAEISALTVAPNDDYDSGTVYIRAAPRRSGQRATITTYPAAAEKYLDIKNLTTTSGRGTASTYSAARTHGSNTITVRGRVPIGRSGSWLITVHKPQLYAGAVFRAELAKRGITVTGRTAIARTPASKRTVIGTDRSMTLAQLLVPFLKLSNNMHAETLTKAMGRAAGRPGNWPDGLAVTRSYLKDLGVPLVRGVADRRLGADPEEHADPAGADRDALRGPGREVVARLLRRAPGGRQPPADGRRHAALPDGRRRVRARQRPRQDRFADRGHLAQRLRHRARRTPVRLRTDQQLHRFVAAAGGELLRHRPRPTSLTRPRHR